MIVSENAKFVEVFARRALAADGLGTWLLPRLVGLQRAKELILLAEDVSAARAYEIGLAARVVPADELDATVADLARRLADGPTGPTRSTSGCSTARLMSTAPRWRRKNRGSST